MQVFNKQFGANILLNTDVISEPVPLKNMFMYNICATITGSPSGSIKLQASNDPETNTTQALPIPVNWVDITNSPFNINSAGRTMWNVTDIAYNYVRVVYTDFSAGASNAKMNLVLNGKGQ